MIPPKPPPDPEALAGTALIGEKIGGWIQELPERRREAFELSRFHGLRHDEIAAVMGVATKTVENHILLALRFLRDKLNAFDPQLLQP
jgi:RNA polymerase sigma-70 factor (ECF subfamily)